MTLSRGLRLTWRAVRALPVVIPQMLVEQLALSVRAFHEPIDGLCLRCRASAPCQPYMDATDDVYKARVAISDYWARRLP